VKAPWIPSLVGSNCGEHYLGVTPGGVIPGGDLDPFVSKPLGGSSHVPKAWASNLRW
jgi:hypothetical protein